ncbi:porin [Methylobacterium dankookense]|uniref:Porin n=1 Tax=Methylobacterium dankookense TaxID=560405 RepID=A0A564G165_9HYPH|nr:porin [Methylobacterium dankookense]GJD57471.1 hypothetical protein IFDJLNFL_3373 [Methylobacterium dankookense]VUF14209.1 Porin Omp2b [Methylobacterium dankookense]
MKLLKSSLLGSAAAVAAAQAADLPVKKAAPIEYVRVCSAYGAGFFYIPGTDTCLRLSGRARFEYGYQAPLARSAGNGDYSGYRGLARINLDARTQTAYGTLRAFVRLETASRTGFPTMHSGTQNRIGNAFPALGVDGYGRVQQYFNTDKAFVQFAGFTAGRASSFFDFYAHDFEIQAGTLGSDVASTNLAAYTATLGNGFSATISMEDPSFRRTPTYSPANVAAAAAVLGNSSLQTFAVTQSPVPVFLGFNAAGLPVGLGFEDAIQRNRMPDFVGVLRYDQPWGSAQISGAVHEINSGNLNTAAAQIIGVNPGTLGRTASEYGWAVQGGLKINLPFIAPGDTLYLQGAYAEGAQMYAGASAWAGSYIQQATSLQGAPFSQFFSDAVLNPLNNRLELTQSFTVVASLLHYWTPTLRSALFGSYGEVAFAPGARAAQASYNGLAIAGITNIGAFGSSYFNLNQILRDTYAFNVGGSLIWSPVKDLDIGVEGVYQNYGVQSGRVIDANRSPGITSQALLNTAIANGTLRTVTNADVFQVRARVQRDF